ncbi:hypothetical protein B0T21DRAFT_388581, partial [Apiosordaria backusii]
MVVARKIRLPSARSPLTRNGLFIDRPKVKIAAVPSYQTFSKRRQLFLSPSSGVYSIQPRSQNLDIMHSLRPRVSKDVRPLPKDSGSIVLKEDGRQGQGLYGKTDPNTVPPKAWCGVAERSMAWPPYRFTPAEATRDGPTLAGNDTHVVVDNFLPRFNQVPWMTGRVLRPDQLRMVGWRLGKQTAGYPQNFQRRILCSKARKTPPCLYADCWMYVLSEVTDKKWGGESNGGNDISWCGRRRIVRANLPVTGIRRENTGCFARLELPALSDCFRAKIAERG